MFDQGGKMRFPEFIEKLPQGEVPMPGSQLFILQAEKHQVAFIRLEKDILVPEHSHAAQWEIPLEGTAEVNIGGEVKVYGPGEPFYVGNGVPHSGKVKSPYAAILIFDTPARYKIKK
jgi:quercetin dioxygenase-like cupin family protein